MSAVPRRPPDFSHLVRSLASRGINRSAIARELHVAPSTVCRWLSAQRKPNSDNTVGLLFLAGSRRR